jgi:hypothetical protein
MGRVMTVQDSIVIEGVTPREVYDLVSDPSRMGRWSPENLGAEVPEPGRAATGGRTFADFQRRNIAKTLARLKSDLEDAATPAR